MTDEIKVVKTLGSVLSSYGTATWLWVIGLSLTGGAASFYQKIRKGAVRPLNLIELVGEIFTSGFVGVVTFLLCEGAGFSPIQSAPIIAISGHMGSRAIFLMEHMFAQRLAPDAPKPAPPRDDN